VLLRPTWADIKRLIGVSQGGGILPLAADRSGSVRFIVSVSGSATVLDETMRYEISSDLKDKGVPGWLVWAVEPVISRRVRRSHGEFWKLNGFFDPLPYWRKLSIPALVLNGALDKNVPVAASVPRGYAGTLGLSHAANPQRSHAPNAAPAPTATN
jgi:hypothetical protein